MKAISKHHISSEEMQKEFEIVERSKTDIAHFEILYNKYYEEIKISIENTLFVNYAIKNEELTKDLTASVFEKAMLKISNYNCIQGIPFKSWLYRIMQNQITEYIRKISIKNKNEKNIELYIYQQETLPTAIFNINEEKKLNYLKKYIHHLAETEQLLIQYRFFNDYSYKEIAQIMGLTENSLRTRMTRLLKKIQTYIENKSA